MCSCAVPNCGFNLDPGNVFGTVQDFELGQQRRRTRLVAAYIAALDAGLRGRVRVAIARDLADLNIVLPN